MNEFVPHPKRKERWEKLKVKLEKNKKISKLHAYPLVMWDKVNSAFDLTKATTALPKKEIADSQLEIFYQYISCVKKSFKFIFDSDATRLHFIAPIVICVSNLFNGDCEVNAQENLFGECVDYTVRVDFILRRGKKAVCLVLPKQVEVGLAQVLIGCELLVEKYQLDTIYGITTNISSWDIYQCSNDKVYMNSSYLQWDSDGFKQDSLKSLVETIYAMLADD